MYGTKATESMYVDMGEQMYESDRAIDRDNNEDDGSDFVGDYVMPERYRTNR
jgi:hypothetical protein